MRDTIRAILNYRHLTRAARFGVASAAIQPDPAKAVFKTKAVLPKRIRDRVRISISRPGVRGRLASVTVSMGRIQINRKAAVR